VRSDAAFWAKIVLLTCRYVLDCKLDGAGGQVVVLDVVGSNPIAHPKENRRSEHLAVITAPRSLTLLPARVQNSRARRSCPDQPALLPLMSWLATR
jgi:hypothetical protein